MAVIKVNMLKRKTNSSVPKLWLLLALASLLLVALEASAYNNSISGLKALQEKTRLTLSSLDKEMVQAYSETTKLNPQDTYTNIADQVLNASRDKIDRLLEAKHEESLRMELIDKLIFKIAEKNPQNFKEELPRIIDEIAFNEMSIGTRYTERDKTLIPFLMNLATALRTRREPIENPLQFIETYIEFSSILNPKPLTEFRSQQGYINQTANESNLAKKSDDPSRQ